MSLNLTNETKKDELCQILYDLYQYKYILILNSFGIVLNTACTLIWSHDQIKAGVQTNFMFKFLQLKSIFDLIFSLSNLIGSVTIQSQFFTGIMNNYVALVAQFCSTYCAIWANLICYITLSSRLRFLLKLNWKIFIGSCVTFSAIFYLFMLVDNFVWLNSKFIFFSIVHTFMRDFLGVILLTLINMATFVEIKRSIDRKKNLNTSGTTSNRTNQLETNFALMVIVVGIMNLIGHFPILFAYLMNSFKLNVSYCVLLSAVIAIDLVYSANFFVYYFFNLKFKKLFHDFLMMPFRS